MPEFPRFCQASTVIRNSFIDSLNHFLIFKANVLIQQLPQMERALFFTRYSSNAELKIDQLVSNLEN